MRWFFFCLDPEKSRSFLYYTPLWARDTFKFKSATAFKKIYQNIHEQIIKKKTIDHNIENFLKSNQFLPNLIYEMLKHTFTSIQ
jgi:hypothetical protein